MATMRFSLFLKSTKVRDFPQLFVVVSMGKITYGICFVVLIDVLNIVLDVEVPSCTVAAIPRVMLLHFTHAF